MRTPQRKLGTLIGLLSLLLVGASQAASKPATKPVATVVAANGPLTVRRQSARTFTPLAVQGALYVGDIVGTGPTGRATLLFSDGSQVRLNANAGVAITAPTSVGKGKKSLFRALSGEMWARLRPGGAVQTPSAIAGVRGTEFDLQVDEDGTTTLTVGAGAVDFFNPYGAVVVGESQQSVARPGTAPSAPVTLPPQNVSLIIEWTLELERAAVPREKFFITPNRRALAQELPRRGQLAQNLPDNPAVRRDHGDALFDTGRYENALEEYTEAERLAPEDPLTLTRLGDTLLELGRIEEAESRYQAVLRIAPRAEAAQIGLAWVALTRNRPAAVPEAVGTEAVSAEASIALGLGFLRQPEHLKEAAQAFQTALNREPAAYHYQARAWLALVYLAQEDPPAALQEAQAAVQIQPQSALAHGNLALVYFFQGQSRQAEREGRKAVQLYPDSVAARCVLGQALLGAGDVDGAAQMAAKAVALDPGLPQAQYLLGIADTQRREYSHAARELQECLRLAPDFLPAASALARVFTNMGRKPEALAFLTDLLPRHPRTDEVRAALGQVFYQQGQYAQAIEQYREALQQKPNSALYHAELARALLDANRLDESLQAGQKAVQLAPDVGQYHAILGLAYAFSRMSVQAEREFREALALDPRNALALLELGLKAAEFDTRENRIFPKSAGLSLEDLLKQGLQAMHSSSAVGSITQGFLHDPEISTQVLRGGVDTGLTLGGGNENQRNFSVTNRTTRGMGAIHSFGVADHAVDDGLRANDDTTAANFSENLTVLTDPRTNVYARVSYRRTTQGLPGSVSWPDLDDRMKDQSLLVQLAGQRRLSRRETLWMGLSRPSGRLELTDSDRDTSFHIPTPDGNSVLVGALRQNLKFHSLVPEVRDEWVLNEDPARPAVLTLGAAYADLKPTYTAHLYFPSTPPETTPWGTRLEGQLTAAYAQWTQRVNDRLSLAAQLRRQRLKMTRTVDFLEGGSMSDSEAKSLWLPSLLVNFRADAQTMLRFFYNRQAQEQDLTSLSFRPVETLLSTEPLILPKGSPDQTTTVELDVERYLASNGFLKLFAFRTTARRVDLGDLPTMPRVVRTGWGLRYERPLRPNLYGQAGLLLNHTTNRTEFAPFDGGTAPYHPRHLAGLSLNYVDRTGTKAGLQLNYTGPFFQDTGVISATQRPRFAERVYVDLTLAKEPSLDREFFLKVTNLFDSRAIHFNDFPTGARRVLAGVTWRF